MFLEEPGAAPLPSQAGAGSRRLPAKHEPGSIDGVLCWDLFDFRDKRAGQGLEPGALDALAVGLGLVGIGIYMLAKRPGDVTNEDAFFEQEDVEQFLRLGDWPTYGLTDERPRYLDADIEPPFQVKWAFKGRSLLEFAIDDGAGNMKVRDKISRQDLAKMVGASREMVSRVMKDLEERGFVQTQDDGSMIVKERLLSLT